MVIDVVNLRQYIGAVIRISASIHLPLIGDAERMGLKLQKHSYCILNRRCAMSCATTIIEENIMFTHLKEYEKMLRKGVCIIPTVQLSPVRMGPLGKQTPSSA